MIEALALRLRNAVQGCSIHIHGPVQAWAAVMEAAAIGEVELRSVAEFAIGASRKRLQDLRELGAKSDDERVRKEELTIAFIEKLLR